MSYIKKTLISNETLIFYGKKHWAFWFKPCFYFLIWLIVGLFIAGFGGPETSKELYLISIASFTMGLITWIYYIIKYQCVEYAVTSRRVILKKGFLIRDTDELKLKSIENIQIYQKILGRIIRYGTLTFTGVGGSSVIFSMVSNPTKIKKLIETQNSKS